VTIIAHSNGGLVTKALIQKLHDINDPLYDDIDNAILVAVPQLGTPEAVSNILHGDTIGYGGVVMSAERFRDLARNMPGAYQLLPSRNYMTSAGESVATPFVTFENGTATAAFTAAYGNTITDTDSLGKFLRGDDGRGTPSYKDLNSPTVLSATLLADATHAHALIDDVWQFSTGTMVYQIAGWGEPTLAELHYRTVQSCDRIDTITVNGYRRYYCGLWGSHLTLDPIEVLDGDGTVVVPSALALSTSTERVKRFWVDLFAYNDPTFGTNRKHKDILEIPNLREFIKEKVFLSRDKSLDFISTSTPSSKASGHQLVFTLHSPLSLSFTDTLGRSIGSSTSTSQDAINKVPGASYRRYGDVQRLSIPASATGTLYLRGIEDGSFTLDICEMRKNEIFATTSFQGIISASTTVAMMTIDPMSPAISSGILSIDRDGDGVVEETLHSTSGATLIEDSIPPETKIRFSTTTEKLLYNPIDNSSTTIESQSSRTILIDKAGNITIVHFASLIHKHDYIKAIVDSISYNGVVTPVHAELSYKWKKNRQGKYVQFAFYLHTENMTVEAHYRPKKNVTIFMLKPINGVDDDDADDDVCDHRAVRETVKGFVIPGVNSSGGKFSIIY
jgi:hypothetical protein